MRLGIPIAGRMLLISRTIVLIKLLLLLQHLLVRRIAVMRTRAIPIPRAVDALQKVCHDAMCVAAGSAPRYFTAEGFAGMKASIEGLSAWARELRRVARHEEHPWNAGLLLESLVSQARRALHSTAYE